MRCRFSREPCQSSIDCCALDSIHVTQKTQHSGRSVPCLPHPLFFFLIQPPVDLRLVQHEGRIVEYEGSCYQQASENFSFSFKLVIVRWISDPGSKCLLPECAPGFLISRCSLLILVVGVQLLHPNAHIPPNIGSH